MLFFSLKSLIKSLIKSLSNYGVRSRACPVLVSAKYHLSKSKTDSKAFLAIICILHVEPYWQGQDIRSLALSVRLAAFLKAFFSKRASAIFLCRKS